MTTTNENDQPLPAEEVLRLTCIRYGALREVLEEAEAEDPWAGIAWEGGRSTKSMIADIKHQMVTTRGEIAALLLEDPKRMEMADADVQAALYAIGVLGPSAPNS